MQLAFGAAGAAIGGFVTGGSGAGIRWGWMIGSGIGGVKYVDTQRVCPRAKSGCIGEFGRMRPNDSGSLQEDII